MDFIPLSTQIEFGSGTLGRECFQVLVMDDDTFEHLEIFLIVMSALDSTVLLPQPELIVMIEDNDRMQIHNLSQSLTFIRLHLYMQVLWSYSLRLHTSSMKMTLNWMYVSLWMELQRCQSVSC